MKEKQVTAQNSKVALTVADKICEFGKILYEGIEKMYEACKLYVEVLDADRTLQASFEEAYPGIPSAAWRRFEAVGRKRIHVKLVTTVTCHQLERCSYEEQEQYVENPVGVLLSNGDVLKVEIKNLTLQQSRQVFSKDHVRGIPEQRAYLESLKTMEHINNTRKESSPIPYRVSRHRLIVGGVSFSREDLFRILVEMEK